MSSISPDLERASPVMVHPSPVSPSSMNRVTELAYQTFCLIQQASLFVFQAINAYLEPIMIKIALFISSFFGPRVTGNFLCNLVLENNKKGVEYLLQKGVDPNSRDANGQTALLLASAKGYTDIVECLLEHGADINLECGISQAAAFNGHAEIVNMIQNRDDYVPTISSAGFNPAIAAYQGGFKKLGDSLGGEEQSTQELLAHRMLTHRFGLKIKIKINEKKCRLLGSGAAITFPVLLDSISRLTGWQDQGPPDWTNTDSEEVLQIIKQAISYTDKEDLTFEDKIKQACDSYQNNKIVLVPSRPSPGHANMIIFSSQYVLRGDRAEIKLLEKTFFGSNKISDKEIFKPGILIETIGKKENVSKAIEKVITATEKHLDRFCNFYIQVAKDLALTSPLHCPHAFQPVDACGWESSAKLGFRGVLIAQLIKKGYSEEEAKEYSYKMYKQWTAEDRLDGITEYIEKVEESDTKTYLLTCIYKHLSAKEVQKPVSKEIIAVIEKEAPQAVSLAEQVSQEGRLFQLKS